MLTNDGIARDTRTSVLGGPYPGRHHPAGTLSNLNQAHMVGEQVSSISHNLMFLARRLARQHLSSSTGPICHTAHLAAVGSTRFCPKGRPFSATAPNMAIAVSRCHSHS